MTQGSHHRALERMYLGAPLNAFFRPRIRIAHETAEIDMDVREDFHHSQIVAEAVVRNADGIEIGRGSGLFVRSKVKLADFPAYRLDD